MIRCVNATPFEQYHCPRLPCAHVQPLWRMSVRGRERQFRRELHGRHLGIRPDTTVCGGTLSVGSGEHDRTDVSRPRADVWPTHRKAGIPCLSSIKSNGLIVYLDSDLERTRVHLRRAYIAATQKFHQEHWSVIRSTSDTSGSPRAPIPLQPRRTTPRSKGDTDPRARSSDQRGARCQSRSRESAGLAAGASRR